MGKILFTGDLHFGHENVLAFDHRPFATIEEMDAELIRRWNNKVQKDDLVYVLGDMIWKSRNSDAETLIRSLNGQKILIKGNHDRFLHNAKAKAALAGIKDYDDICVELEDGTKKRVILSHYFMPMYIGHRYEAIHLHAHSHVSEEANYELGIAEQLNAIGCHNEIYNVGCMYWNYEPVTLDEILAGWETAKAEFEKAHQPEPVYYPFKEEADSSQLVWRAFYQSWNRKRIDVFNIFDHYGFREELKKAAKKCKTKEEFAPKLRGALLYYYWSKCEWEVVIKPWISRKDAEDLKVDVYWQVMNNWSVFLDYVWENRKKL